MKALPLSLREWPVEALEEFFERSGSYLNDHPGADVKTADRHAESVVSESWASRSLGRVAGAEPQGPQS